METLESLRQRIESARDLQSVVKTMKSLAAVSIRHYERAANSIEEYNRVVELGLHIALHNRPEGSSIAAEMHHERLGAVIFGSDQGMCGQFNERLAEFAVDRMNGMQIRRQHRSVLALGRRVTGHLHDAHQPIERAFDMPSSITGMTEAVHELLQHVEYWQSQQQIDQIVIFYNRQAGGAAYAPQIAHLLPLDLDWLHTLEEAKWPFRTLPTFRMDWEPLFASLIREHFFVTLYRAFAQSLASENAARLAAMQAAERNIEDKLTDFNFRYQQQRQRAITEELLDITAGFEAIRGDW
ncbi:F0F1 ATP synthase subunit gamma [bacterium]|nr:F0F1 ATP synthase subunit gamma [bacterium]